MNSVDVSRQERELLKEFLKAEDKLTVYPMLCEFHNSLFNYLTLQLPFKFLSDLNENEKSIYNSKRSILKLIEAIELNHYKEWIKKEDKKYLYKNAANYDRKLQVYDREMRFKPISTKDPYTDDEKEYVLEFIKECFPERNYTHFEDLPIESVRIALNNLLTN